MTVGDYSSLLLYYFLMIIYIMILLVIAAISRTSLLQINIGDEEIILISKDKYANISSL